MPPSPSALQIPSSPPPQPTLLVSAETRPSPAPVGSQEPVITLPIPSPGNSGANNLSGLAGNENLLADGGNDTLIGGTGADILTGGTCKDTFHHDLTDSLLGTAGTPAYNRITDLVIGADRTVTFRKVVTPGLPFRRPELRVAPGSVLAPLLAC